MKMCPLPPPFIFPTLQTDLPKVSLKDKQAQEGSGPNYSQLPFQQPTAAQDQAPHSARWQRQATLTESGSQWWIQAEGCHLHERIKPKSGNYCKNPRTGTNGLSGRSILHGSSVTKMPSRIFANLKFCIWEKMWLGTCLGPEQLFKIVLGNKFSIFSNKLHERFWDGVALHCKLTPGPARGLWH